MHRKNIYIWLVLGGINAFDLLLSITTWRFSWFDILNALALAYAVWEIVKSSKALKAEQASLRTMHNVNIYLSRAEDDAKDTAAKIANELHFKLKND